MPYVFSFEQALFFRVMWLIIIIIILLTIFGGQNCDDDDEVCSNLALMISSGFVFHSRR